MAKSEFDKINTNKLKTIGVPLMPQQRLEDYKKEIGHGS